MFAERVTIPGSNRLAHPNARPAGEADPKQIISVTVMLRRKKELPKHAGKPISRETFAKTYGARPEDVPVVEQFAFDHNLTLESIDLTRRTVVLSGTVGDLSEAFGTQLSVFHSPDGQFRGRTGELFVPATLAGIITGVFGLDDRPQARTRLRRYRFGVTPRAAGDTSYSPVDLAKLYQFPTKGTGTGQTVAIIELGGGFRNADLNAYFAKLNITPAPKVSAVGIDGAANQPDGDPNSADGEVLLDIEVVGAVAPGAAIAVYFAPNTDQGFLDAITTAIHDSIRKPSVISISWGGPESSWTAQSLKAYDEAFQEAGLVGVTVCCASGDDGSTDGATDGLAHVDFPSSSPNVLACGGTRLESADGKVTNEVIWNHGPGNGAGGGGVSETFPVPKYQAHANTPPSVNASQFKGRGVPDISGDADPATGYRILVDGKEAVFGGTSAVAPLWAGLIALVNEELGKPVGFLNPILYGPRIAGTAALRDIVSGTNGAYSAGPGWDACSGLGSPNGQALLKALRED